MAETAQPSRVVGVLGGMGPAATVDFYDKLVRATPARHDQDHLRVVIWADPTVPNRHAALAGEGEDPEPWLRRGVRRLVASGADLLVCPCNTAHAFLPSIAADERIELISIIDAAVEELPSGAGQRVGLLAADGARASGLYQSALRERGLEPVLPSPQAQQELMEAIYRVKADPDPESTVRQLGPVLDELENASADSVVVGCTELSTVVEHLDTRLTLVDASQALARRTVLRAR